MDESPRSGKIRRLVNAISPEDCFNHLFLGFSPVISPTGPLQRLLNILGTEGITPGKQASFLLMSVVP